MTFKGIYIVGLLSFLPLCSWGQATVSVPDTSFVRCLKSKYSNLFASNGQMIKSIAAGITGKLDFSGANIRDAEGLQYFTNVTEVNLSRNEMNTMPHIGTLTKLVNLNVSYNNLKYIKGIERLLSLQELYCYKNQLQELTGLNSLSKLVRIEAHENQLIAVPTLGVQPLLTYFSLNQCNIASLTDFSKCPVLSKVRLYNNLIPFGEMLNLVSFSNYETRFPLDSQEIFPQGFTRRVKEADALVLSTGLDQGVPDVRYIWYKNNQPIDTTWVDSLIISKVALADSGSYACHLRHPSFPAITLKTNAFEVKVLPCIDMAQVSIHTSPINCLNTGSVFVNSGTDKIKTFVLKSMTTSEKVESPTGSFSTLSELQYSLSLIKANGCTKKYDKPIILTQEDCDEILLSPDNDGLGDTYFFKEQGMVIIYDKQGQRVKTLPIPGVWDGSSDRGKVFSGFYVADINDGAKLLGITVLY